MNHLAHETSPYLLQHRDNPVDWYPWGPEALDLAKRLDKPILLSIGYSACHWCHVMAHESFEDPIIAGLMNERFVNIKVDREERPDLDSIYMNAVQLMTGHGGWPLTVFLTPEGNPFFGGTYFPPAPRFGHPGFPQVLARVATAYREQREAVEHNTREVLANLHRPMGIERHGAELTHSLLDQAVDTLRAQADPLHGGFGGAPKFPPSMSLELLLRAWHREGRDRDRALLTLTLDAMTMGGLYDQIGGGFHRYSVDERWLVPHFEKMLYDNALLARLYLLAYEAFGTDSYRTVAAEVLDWVAREMTTPEGGFISTMDADSEGVEGRFYVWTPEETAAVLGPELARVFDAAYDITREGNFEGKSLPNLRQPLAATAHALAMPLPELTRQLADARRRLYDARATRVWPGRDDKVITAWNGMMLRAFAEAGSHFARPGYLELAARNAEFLLTRMRRDGRLYRTFKHGEARIAAFLEDYANLVDGLLALYAATFAPRWLEEAKALAETMVSEFWDAEHQSFYDTGERHEVLIVRPQDRFDNATPAGNSVACDVLLRLATYLGRPEWRELAMGAIARIGGLLARYPNGFGRLLCALDFALAPTTEVAIVGAPGPATEALVRAALDRYRPYQVVATTSPERGPGPVAFLAHRHAAEGEATAYVCVDQTCSLPLTDPASLNVALSRRPRGAQP